MKQLKLIIVMLFAASLGNGQTLVNGSFENWNTVNTLEPANWLTNNAYTPHQFIPVTRVSGTTGNAARIATTGNYYLSGIIFTPASDPFTGQGGVPFTGTGIPTHLQGAYRYDIAPGDTSIIALILKKNGAIISQEALYVTGSQSAFATFSLPLQNITVVPDTLMVVVMSSAINSIISSGPHSWIEVDDLDINTSAGVVPIPGGDFDTWAADSVRHPDFWSVINDVARSSDASAGNYAVRLTTDVTSNDARVAIASSGGILLGNRVDTLVGYYKYFTPGNDTGEISVTIEDPNYIVNPAVISVPLPPASAYKEFKIPLPPLAGVPQSLAGVSLYSVRIPSLASAVDSSVLLVDDLRVIQGLPLSVQNIPKGSGVTVYPNPVQDMVYINSGHKSEPVHIKLTDITGATVGEEVADGSVISLSVKHLPAGMYYLHMQQGEHVISQKIIKQ